MSCIYGDKPNFGIMPPDIVPSLVRTDRDELGIFSKRVLVLSSTPTMSVKRRRRSAYKNNHQLVQHC